MRGMRRAPRMTASEFRDIVDGQDLPWRELEELSGRSQRAIKSYYYGERPVPPHVALILTQLPPAATRQTAEPWWDGVIDRFANLATSQMRQDRAGMKTAIAAYCKGCEPEGICRTSECPLREFSPFVFVARRAA